MDAEFAQPARTDRNVPSTHGPPWGASVVLAILALLCLGADEAPEEKAAPQRVRPIGQFVTVESPIDDSVYRRVTEEALKLQHRAEQEQRPTYLVLELGSGTSQFHQVLGLAKFLTSAELSRVRTVAWIPETVTGNNVLLALVCREIVMHPDAELGDMGRGSALDADEQQAVLNLVRKRSNPLISPALALGMMAPSQRIWQIRVEGVADATETRIVSEAELQGLRQGALVISDTNIVKEPGMVGRFSGQAARDANMLANRLATSRAETAELYDLPREALREDPAGDDRLKVRLIKIDGMIEPVLETFLERQIDRAVSEGANRLIFEIDSPGGFLLSSTNLADAIAALDPKLVRTVAYIPRQALSGAAIIALGCDEIYLHPDAQIGDAGPIEMREGGQFERAPEKIVSTLRNTVGALADKKGRPRALAEAMADKNLVVYQVRHRDNGRVWYMTEEEIHKSNGEWITDRPVPETGEDLLLTVNGVRAHELEIAERPVIDKEELKARLGIPPGTILAGVKRTWVDTLIFVLNTQMATFWLFVFGVVFIYLELVVPSGFFGIASTLCFSMFFWSRFLGGTAGWLEVVLFVLGLALLGMEIFVVPGFGVFGVSGILMLLGSLVMASQTFGNLEPYADLNALARTVGMLSMSLVTVIILAIGLSTYMPYIPGVRRLIHAAPDAALADGPRLRPTDGPLPGEESPLIGRRGEAFSMLRPAGRIRLEGRLLDVVSEGGYVNAGSEVEVVQVEGNRIVVREVS